MTRADQLIEKAKGNGGAVEFTVGAGTGITLGSLRALRKRGHTLHKIGGEWQSKAGMQYRMTLAAIVKATPLE